LITLAVTNIDFMFRAVLNATGVHAAYKNLAASFVVLWARFLQLPQKAIGCMVLRVIAGKEIVKKRISMSRMISSSSTIRIFFIF
jgi:hypothetical protein